MKPSLSPECHRILASVSAYLDGDLGASDCQSIETHCRECVHCADVVAGLRDTVGLCRKAGSAPIPDAVRQRARESVRRLLDREPNIQPR